MNDNPWNFETCGLLTDLWSQGLSAKQIALRLGKGFTRNSVIGKAHRLNLPPRPSPIIREKKVPIFYRRRMA